MPSHTLLCLASGLLAGLAAAQLPQPAPQAASPQVLRAVYLERLEVKLAEGSEAELRDGRLVSRSGVDLSSVARWFAQADAQPLVTAVPRAQLDAWHAHACSVLPEHNRPGHLGLWFKLVAGDAATAERLRQQLAAEPMVEHVYHEPVLYPASAPFVTGGDLPPTTPSFTSLQLSHAPSPLGHGVRQVAGILGARGQGVGMRMIENGWVWDHEDLCQVVQANVIGAMPPMIMPDSNHGIAGASITFGDRNAYGVTGVADEVDVLLTGINVNGGYANAMAITLANSQPGDVSMIVIMILVPSLGPGTWLPLEFLQSSFDATLTATANGLHVVLPAGNGNRSLDDPALLGRFDRNFRDSGSIIVGASEAGLLQKASFSNFGSRVDAHSWGDQVYACGYGTIFFGNNDLRQSYTASGTGTSSATPHIAGVVAALQGAARRQLGQALSNQQILDLLHTVGPTTPDVIGRRPDLLAMMQQLGIVDGLLVQEPDVMLGDTIVADLDGPPNSLAALFGSFATADIPLGFNRNIHLDLLAYSPLGSYVLVNGAAQYTLPVPNNAALHGADIYFQAVRLSPGQPLHVTNSCQVTIL
ncbi:MAG: S8 family serine peptidase [Planctomycetes bacterium]|nr:S8 family serine peptidase [Planctomycetota bacterium]